MLKRIEKTATKELREYLDSRSQEISSEIILRASEIIDEIRKNGDEVAKAYTKKFDGIEIDDFRGNFCNGPVFLGQKAQVLHLSGGKAVCMHKFRSSPEELAD